MTENLLIGALVVDFILLCLLLWVGHKLIKERKEFAERWGARPIGQIINTEVTDAGILVTGEVWDPEVKKKLAQDMTGFSIGYKGSRD